jgi:predicted Fe-Mo cluster-binding NifX family protein
LKIVIAANGSQLESTVAKHFGRCKKFIFYETAKGEIKEVMDNPGAQAPCGAGIQAAQKIIYRRPYAVLTGHIGPNAYTLLSSNGMKICSAASGTVRDAIEQFMSQRIVPGTRPTEAMFAGIEDAETDPDTITAIKHTVTCLEYQLEALKKRLEKVKRSDNNQ